jgi:branched-chain amino acid transport system ATP-binding protein
VSPAEQALLSVRSLHAGYGVMEAVHGIDLDVSAGEMVSIVGRNGAGKSTTMAAIAGVRQGRFRGSVQLDGIELSRRPMTALVASGLSLVPEGHRVFHELSVVENLRVGGYSLRHSSAALHAQLDIVYELFAALGQHRKVAAGNLSGGQQQMVAIGQALMSRPRVLILDEPSSGLALAVVDDIYQAVHKLKDEGLALLMVEQNVTRALRESDRCYVFEGGRVALGGRSADLASDNRVNEIVTGVAASREIKHTATD